MWKGDSAGLCCSCMSSRTSVLGVYGVWFCFFLVWTPRRHLLMPSPLRVCTCWRRQYESLFFAGGCFGLIPGGAPFRQLRCQGRCGRIHKLVKCHFVTKTCKKADWNNTQEEGDAENATAQENDGFGETIRKHLCQSQYASHKNVEEMKEKFSLLAFNLSISRNTVLWKVKCELNPQAMASRAQKWWKKTIWEPVHIMFHVSFHFFGLTGDVGLVCLCVCLCGTILGFCFVVFFRSNSVFYGFVRTRKTVMMKHSNRSKKSLLVSGVVWLLQSFRTFMHDYLQVHPQ